MKTVADMWRRQGEPIELTPELKKVVDEAQEMLDKEGLRGLSIFSHGLSAFAEEIYIEECKGPNESFQAIDCAISNDDKVVLQWGPVYKDGNEYSEHQYL